MDVQPNEIITHMLSYLDNHTLMFARSTCHKWKHLIETRIFYKKNIPSLHVCILTDDYYHFGKYYLNYNYDTKKIWIRNSQVDDVNYYDNLVIILPNKKIFRNILPQTNVHLSINELLRYASYKGHLEVVKYLISIGVDLHAANGGALRFSTQNGHLEVTKYLISIMVDLHARNDCALPCPWNGLNRPALLPLLQGSAEKGHLEIVKYLISMGADLHAENEGALQWSARNGHLEVVKYLISMGADLHADNDYVLQCSAGGGHLEMVKYLINVGADLRADNDCALRWSAKNGHLEVVKYLISIGADLHAHNDYIFHSATQEVIEYLNSLEKN